MKIFLTGIMCFIVFSVFSQDGQEQIELPSIIPPSPTAYELGKYGNIPVNEATGMANIGIPLHTYKTSNLEVPISLSYATSGIKVDQVASWTGMGWNLNAGGVITRTVKGKPDDKYPTHFPDISYINNLVNTDPLEYARFFYDVPMNVNIETQPDIFNFKLSGYSGSFIIDENHNPILLARENSLIIEQNQYREFIITTPNGVKYYFGNNEIEYTQQKNTCSGSGGTEFEKTAWYLYKIKHPKGDEVYLDYIESSYRYFSGFSESFVYIDPINDNGTCPFPKSGKSTCVFNTDIRGKVLSKIRSNRSTNEIHFTSTQTRKDIYGNHELDSIKVYNQSNFIKGYKFNYSDIHSNKSYLHELETVKSPDHFYRLYLTSIQELNINQSPVNGKIHFFEYNSPEDLPPRLSYSQDFLGFYNGKINKSFLPETMGREFNGLEGVIRGDRNADLDFVQKGILNKVVYPTKGYTKLEYEPVAEIITNNKSYVTTPVFLKTNTNVDPINNTNGPIQIINKTLPDDIQINYNHDIELNVKIEGGDKFFVDVIVQNITSGEEIFNGHYVEHLSLKKVIPLKKDQTYRFTIITNFHITNLSAVESSIDFNYITETFKEVDPQNKSGIRIKRVINKASENAPEEIIRYYYNQKENISEYSLKKLTINNYAIKDSKLLVCSSNNPGGSDMGEYSETLLSDNSIKFNYSPFISDFHNSFVTISKGENFENGGIEKRFLANRNVSGNLLIGQPFSNMNLVNSSLFDGDLLEQIFLKKENGLFVITKKEENKYLIDESKDIRIHGYQGNKRYVTIATYRDVHNVSGRKGFDINYYPIFSRWKSHESTITTKYDTEGEEIFSTTTNYSYESGLAGLPSKTIITNSDGNTIETQVFYPDDVEQTTSLGGNTLTFDEFQAIDKLKTGKLESRIGTPIQTITNNNGSKSTQRTLYKTWTNSTQPEFVQTLKGAYNATTNPLENRIQYHGYYSNGNVKEVSKTDGTHIIYIWGYNEEYPIAKIENATYSQVQSYVADLQTKSNADNDNCKAVTCKEQILRETLQDLRDALPNAMTSTYTYDPLIGVTSMTDPKGYTIYYQYDDFNRLEFIKDADGNLISENKYNYKN